MSQYKELVEQLKTVREDRLGVFALAGAERVAPVFRRFAQIKSVDAFDRILNELWDSVMLMKAVNSSNLIRQIEAIDESQARDSQNPSFYAMMALSVLNDAATCFDKPAAMKAATSVVSGCLNLTNNFDVILSGSGVRRVNPRQLPEPGPLAAAEGQAQRAIIERLKSNDLDINSMRTSSAEHARELQSHLRAIAEKKNWL